VSFTKTYKPYHPFKQIMPIGTPKGHQGDKLMLLQKGFRNALEQSLV